MQNRGLLTTILAVLGTLLVWVPLLAPVLFGLVRVAGGRPLIIDFLMPAELFPLALMGGALLLWAARRARRWQRVTGWGTVAAVALLITSQAMAVVTGLASGATEATGWPWVVVLGLLAGYVLALLVVAVAGLLLVRDTFRRS